MRSKICYLLGAGASCDTLPLAKDLGNALIKSLEQFRNAIKFTFGSPDLPYPEDKKPWPQGEYGRDFLESLQWLGKYARQHSTVDTLARKLWIRMDKTAKRDLRNLKGVLSCFFLYEQSRFPSDMRYDNFFASILERNNPGEPLFPNDLAIVSWNYDLALEKAYYEFCLNQEIVEKHISNNPNVVRLNGLAGYVRPDVAGVDHIPYEHYMKSIFDKTEISIVNIMDLYNRFFTPDDRARLNPQISFAWETSNAVELASRAITDAEILVIIGYSFPFFNQNIDGSILKSAKSLRQIYIQSKNDTASRERLLQLLEEVPHPENVRWDFRVENISGTDYFFIPNEFVKNRTAV